MTSRERWTIYPLLFLAIGLGLRNRVMGFVEIPAVECQTLTLVGPDGKPTIRLGTLPSGAPEIGFFSPDGNLLLAAGASPDGKTGMLTIAGSAGKPTIRLGTLPTGSGQIDFLAPDGKLLLAAGASPDGKAGQFLIQNSEGMPQVELASNGQTGLLRVCGPDGKPTAMMQTSSRGGMFVALTADHKLQLITGHDNLDSGVLIDTANGQRLAVPFGPVVRKPAPAKEKPAEPAEPQEEAKPEPAAPAEKK